jgi:5-methylcytosine-specific restriction endonuclease McrA
MPRSIRTADPPGGKSARKTYDEARGSAAARGYDRRHEKWRKLVLARDPLCRIQKLCGKGAKRELPDPATVADHVIPLRATWAQLSLEQRGRVMSLFGTHDFLTMDPKDALRQYVWTMENGQGACRLCHDAKTREETACRR